MSFLQSSPGKTNLPDVFKLYPRRSILMLRLIDDILRGDSPFTVAERELIFAFASSQKVFEDSFLNYNPEVGVVKPLFTPIAPVIK